MKKFIAIATVILLIFAGINTGAQDRNDELLGLPGDNLNLYAVMKVFQESKTLEEFERQLNDENLHINNLDLNGDNQVDYITVNDYVDGNVHNIVLRDAINSNESQDVAVFTVERFNDGTVNIQLVGDEALYGKNYIVEPVYASKNETPNPGYVGEEVVETTGAEVAAWPMIRFIFLPEYIPWHSVWYWGYYPEYWHPWNPWYRDYYFGFHSYWYTDYHRHFRLWNDFRYPRYHDYYYSHIRSYSPVVGQRIREGNFRETRTRPALRREGALYAKERIMQTKEISNTPGNTERRNSVSGATRGRISGNTQNEVPGRSRSAVNTRSSGNSPAVQENKINIKSETRKENASDKSQVIMYRRPSERNTGRSYSAPQSGNSVTRSSAGTSRSVSKSHPVPAVKNQGTTKSAPSVKSSANNRGNSRSASTTTRESRRDHSRSGKPDRKE